MRLTTESLNLKAKSLYVTLNFIVFIPSRSIRSVKCWQIFPELEFIQSNSKRSRQSSFLHAAPHHLNSAWNRLKLKRPVYWFFFAVLGRGSSSADTVVVARFPEATISKLDYE